eukprot:199202-Hanusia_phi.AAC.7
MTRTVSATREEQNLTVRRFVRCHDDDETPCVRSSDRRTRPRNRFSACGRPGSRRCRVAAMSRVRYGNLSHSVVALPPQFNGFSGGNSPES